jgi:hypothetical protein
MSQDVFIPAQPGFFVVATDGSDVRKDAVIAWNLFESESGATRVSVDPVTPGGYPSST